MFGFVNHLNNVMQCVHNVRAVTDGAPGENVEKGDARLNSIDAKPCPEKNPGFSKENPVLKDCLLKSQPIFEAAKVIMPE
jgi:hypothetical protein